MGLVQLYSDNSTDPIACYRACTYVLRPSPATLTILPQAEDMQDIILTSLLIVGRKMRSQAEHSASVSRAGQFMLLQTNVGMA